MTISRELEAARENRLRMMEFPGGLFRPRVTLAEVKELFGTLGANHSVTEIDLSGNKITDEEVKVLAEALKTNEVVREINLRNNKIGDEGAKFLVEGLKKNYSVIDLDLSSNKISKQLLSEIQLLINRNCQSRDKCHEAVKKGDLLSLKRLFTEGASLHSSVGWSSLLNTAVRGDHAEIVAYLLEQYRERKISIDSLIEDALDIAIRKKNKKIVELLLEATSWGRSDHSLLTDNLSEPLQTTKVEDGTEHQVERQKQWKEALSAIKAKREEYHKQDKECRDKRQKLNETPTTAEGYHEIEEDYKKAQRKLEEAKQALSDAEENSRRLASELNALRTETVGYKAELEKLSQEKKKLQDKLAEINRREKDLKIEREINTGAPLFGAIMRKDKASLEEILNEGHDVNSFTDKNGRTLLCRAVEGESIDIVKLLLERGASPDKKDDSNETPLHRAVKLQNNSYSITELLISFGAYVDMRMKNGISTVLHLAVAILDPKLIRLLVEAGADVNIPMKDGKTTVAYLEGIMAPLKKKIIDKEKEYGSGVLVGQAEEEVKAMKKALASYEDMSTLLKKAANEKDPNIGYTKAERLIEIRLGALVAKYGTAIYIQSKRPEILEEQGIANIILSTLDNLDSDYQQIKKILDPNISHPIPLLPIDRETFEQKIEGFFEFWRSELKKADDQAKSKLPKITLSLSQPASAFSSPTSSMED